MTQASLLILVSIFFRICSNVHFQETLHRKFLTSYTFRCICWLLLLKQNCDVLEFETTKKSYSHVTAYFWRRSDVTCGNISHCDSSGRPTIMIRHLVFVGFLLRATNKLSTYDWHANFIPKFSGCHFIINSSYSKHLRSVPLTVKKTSTH